MTFTIYGEDLLLGMWPWGTLWGQNLRSSPAAVTDRTRSGVRVSSNQNDMGGDNNPWTLRKRLFTTPAVTTEQAPWVTYINNHTGEFHNAWGQRVEGTCLFDGDAYFTTSAKNVDDVKAAKDLIPAAAQQQYNRVWRMSLPNQASGHFRWATMTTLEFDVEPTGIVVRQDGAMLANKSFARYGSTATAGADGGAEEDEAARWLGLPPRQDEMERLTVTTCNADGIFGGCAAGVQVEVHLDL